MNHPHPDLGLPSPLITGGLRIVALGGLGEIGRNMTVFETKGKLLIVDCGVLFPEDTQPGIDLILPDFSYIRDSLADVVGVFLTHGHEDHIGAVPYLLRERGDIALYGSALTLALVTAKLKEHRITPLTREVREGGHEDVGPFELEFVAVNHSIPDALAVVINTDAGRVLATGDFKMDQLPLDGRITDLRTFARLGEEGVDLFMVDSTNADIPGFTPSEREIMPALNRVIGSTKRRVIVASFSSHVHRVQQVIDTAALHNRKVVFIGRSMVRNMKIAQDMGYLTVPAGILMDAKDLDSFDDNVVLIIQPCKSDYEDFYINEINSNKSENKDFFYTAFKKQASYVKFEGEDKSFVELKNMNVEKKENTAKLSLAPTIHYYTKTNVITLHVNEKYLNTNDHDLYYAIMQEIITIIHELYQKHIETS